MILDRCRTAKHIFDTCFSMLKNAIISIKKTVDTEQTKRFKIRQTKTAAAEASEQLQRHRKEVVNYEKQNYH